MISADDVAALRYLAIALGAVAAGLVFAAGPESPWVVAVFILAVIVCVLGAIFALRRWGKGREKRPADDERSRSSDPERK